MAIKTLVCCPGTKGSSWLGTSQQPVQVLSWIKKMQLADSVAIFYASTNKDGCFILTNRIGLFHTC